MSQTKAAMAAGLSRRQLLRLGVGAALGAVFGLNQDAASANGARIIRHVSTNARKVCLTYDDLWSEYYTLRIAREYSRRHVGLTLFPAGIAVLNNLRRPNAGYENLYPRMRDMGHEFGCHLFTHREINNFGLQQLIDEEMEPTLDVMRRALGPGFRPVGIRPPYGKVTDALKELSIRYGIPLILWGLDSQDAICTKAHENKEDEDATANYNEVFANLSDLYAEDAQCSVDECPEVCVKAILKNYEAYLRPGAIILHHALKTSYTAIQPTLDLLRDWNMQPLPLSQLLAYSA